MMNNYSNEFLECKDCAFYYINKRRYTKKELIDKLVKKKYDISVAREVADYLEEAKYIDDADYSRRFINDAVNLKKHGLVRIKRDLSMKGVDRSVVDDVLCDLEIDTKSVLAGLIETKASNMDLTDEKQLNKLNGFLLRRGFNYCDINEALYEYRNKRRITNWIK